MADPKAPLNDPEVNSEFAKQKRLAKEKGTPPGVDPVTGERGAITYRQLYNETDGDAARAREIFDAVKKAGGYGDVGLEQALDVRSLDRMPDTIRDAIKKGVDLKGDPLDRFGKDQMEQLAQHQDNLRNDVREIIREYEKG